MLFKKYKDSSTPSDRHFGGESIFIAILTCIIISVMGVSLARLHNVSFMSLVSSETSMQAQHFAKSKMDYLMFKGYNNLATQAKTVINGTTFKDSVALGTITTDADGVKKRTVTVSVYNDDEASPRATLSHVFYSNDADLYVRNGNSTANSISMHYDSSNDRLYAKVDGNEKPLGGASVPTGTVLSWYGNIANIPNGFVLCDGNNGTPDLRDRFIVGAGNSYSCGATGGANTVTLNTNQIPSHAHTRGTMEISGSILAMFFGHANNTGALYYSSLIQNSTSPDRANDFTEMYGTLEFNASRNWSGETSYVGGSQAHENRPPYYALYYIMKL